MLEIKIAIILLLIIIEIEVMTKSTNQQEREKTALIFAQASRESEDIDTLLWRTDAIKEMQEIADKYGINFWKDSIIEKGE